MDYLQLLNIATSGGGLIIDAKRLDYLQLLNIAGAKKAPLIIRNASALDFLQCVNIAAAGKGNVTFDFTS